MTEQAQRVWELICKEYERTKRAEVTVEIPKELKDFKEEIGRELKVNNLISNFNFCGRLYMRCKLTIEGSKILTSRKGV